MLTEYNGAANTPDILQHLVGEEITGAFFNKGHMILVLSSGCALVVCGFGGDTPSYWKMSLQETRREVEERRAQLERMQREVERVTALRAVT